MPRRILAGVPTGPAGSRLLEGFSVLGIAFRLVVVSLMFLACLGVLAVFGHGDKWQVALGATAVGYLAGSLLVRRLLFLLMTAPFKAKGAVLRGARVEVHALRRAPVLAFVGARVGDGDEESSHEPDGRRPDWRYFEADLTVIPTDESTGPFLSWHPGELQVLPFEASTAPTMSHSEAEDLAAIEDLEVWDGERFVADEGLSYSGPQRIRFTLGAAPIVTVAKLRYCFEGLGRLELPGDGT